MRLTSLLVLAGLALGLVGGQPVAAKTRQGKGYALLVGVRDYEHRDLAPLRYTENDVEHLARLLDVRGSRFHGRVRILTCTRGEKNRADRPTAANIRKALTELLKNRTRHDTVLIALSGHGMQLRVPDPDGKLPDKTFPYFCPVDAQTSGIDYRTGRHDRLIHMEEMMAELGECGAGAKLVLVDACRNEMRKRAARRSLEVKKEMVPEGVAALFSCKSGQFAHEVEALKHGVFFHFVIAGLKGAAKNTDGEVTWGLLAEFVTRHVSRQVPSLVGKGAEQTPQEIKNTDGESPLLLRYAPRKRTGRPAYLGVRLQDLDAAQAKKVGLEEPTGALVTQLLASSPAEKAGLKVGDVIRAVWGRPVRTSQELKDAIAVQEIGKPAVLDVYRDRKPLKVRVLLAEQPKDLDPKGRQDDGQGIVGTWRLVRTTDRKFNEQYRKLNKDGFLFFAFTRDGKVSIGGATGGASLVAVTGTYRISGNQVDMDARGLGNSFNGRFTVAKPSSTDLVMSSKDGKKQFVFTRK